LKKKEGIARRKEAISEGDYGKAVGSWLAWQATGDGIVAWKVLRNMILLFLGATIVYWIVGLRGGSSPVFHALYYSVVTFTTAPPYIPQNNIVGGVAMVETFLGTFLLISLGFVLGNRTSITHS